MPSGWSATFTNTSVNVSHTVGSYPFLISAHGQTTSGGTGVSVKTGAASGVAGSFTVVYTSGTNTAFNIQNITTGSLGTVSSGSSTIYVLFL